MLEIKVTYFPISGSEAGPLCISERLSTELLATAAEALPGETAKKLTRILFENSKEFKDEFLKYTHSSKPSSSVELSQCDVSNQLNEKNNASDARLFPFYVTYGCGTNLAHCFSTIRAKDYAAAEKLVIDVCGRQYAFVYDAAQFAGQVEAYNLKLVALQPQRML